MSFKSMAGRLKRALQRAEGDADKGAGASLDWAGLYDYQAGLRSEPPAEFLGMFDPFPPDEAPHAGLEARIREAGVPPVRPVA